MLQQIGIQIKALCHQRWIKAVLHLALLLGLVLLLYLQLSASATSVPWQELNDYWQHQVTLGTLFIALLWVVLLMPLNWALETHKWIALMGRVLYIPFYRALQAVLAGLTVSLFTPNRVGEYGGRVLLVESEYRVHAVFATIVGSMSQWLVIVSGGVLGLLYLLAFGQIPPSCLPGLYSILALALPLLMGVFWVYFRLSSSVALLLRLFPKQSWAIRLQQQLLGQYDIVLLYRALFLSALRYFTYSLQYVCLLYCLGFGIEPTLVWAIVSLVFLLQTGLPIPPSLGLLARGSIALWVFTALIPEQPHSPLALQSVILAATFGLWFINVLIPALLGVLVIGGRTWKA